MAPFSIIFVGEFCVTIYKHYSDRLSQSALFAAEQGDKM